MQQQQQDGALPEAATVSSQLDALAAEMAAQERALAEASYYLPTFDQKHCTAIVQEFKSKLEAARTSLVPKRKFAFARKVARVKGTDIAAAAATDATATASSSSTGQAGAGCASGSSTAPDGQGSNTEEAPCFSERDVALVASGRGLQGLRNQVIVMTADQLGAAADFVLLDLEGCTVYLLGQLAALRMLRLRACRVFTGPVTGATFVDDARGCTFVLAAYQVLVCFMSCCWGDRHTIKDCGARMPWWLVLICLFASACTPACSRHVLCLLCAEHGNLGKCCDLVFVLFPAHVEVVYARHSIWDSVSSHADVCAPQPFTGHHASTALPHHNHYPLLFTICMCDAGAHTPRALVRLLRARAQPADHRAQHRAALRTIRPARRAGGGESVVNYSEIVSTMLWAAGWALIVRLLGTVCAQQLPCCSNMRRAMARAAVSVVCLQTYRLGGGSALLCDIIMYNVYYYTTNGYHNV